MPTRRHRKNDAAAALAHLRWARTTARERTEAARAAAKARWARPAPATDDRVERRH